MARQKQSGTTANASVTSHDLRRARTWRALLVEGDYRESASPIRFQRSIPRGTMWRRRVVDSLKRSGEWPPQQPRVIFHLVENLLAAQDHDPWSAPVERALHLAMSDRRVRRRRLYEHWDALTQLNAYERIWREWRVTTQAREQAQLTAEAERVAVAASLEVARIAAQQQMLRHSEKGGRPPKVRSILEGWNPTRGAGRFEGCQGSWLLLCFELWRDLRRQVAGARPDGSVRDDLAELLVAWSRTAPPTTRTVQQKKLVAAYHAQEADRGHLRQYSARAAMARALVQAYKLPTVKRLEKLIHKAQHRARQAFAE